MGKLRNSGGGGGAGAAAHQVPHRPGPLVQSNKKHKFGKHRTNGMIDQLNSGRVSSSSTKSKKLNKHHVKRSQRRKQATALRNQRLRETIDMKRLIGGGRGASISVILIPLSSTTNPQLMLQHLISLGQGNFENLSGSNQIGNFTHLRLKNGKNLTLTIAPPTKETTDLWTMLDLVKMSDIVLFLLPILEPLSPEALTLLRSIKDQGLTTPFLAVGHEFSKVQEKQFLKSVGKSYFPTLERIFPISNPGQISNLFRMMSVSKITLPKSSSLRPGMLIESFQTVPISPEILPGFEEEENLKNFEILQTVGIVRRRNLDPRKFVHIPGSGNYQILRVDVIGTDSNEAQALALPPRFLLDPKASTTDGTETEEADEDMMNDDTMSVGTMDMDEDEDFDSNSGSDGDEEEEMSMKKKRLPKGTSDYQADWLEDDSEVSGDEDEESSGDKSTLGSDHSGSSEDEDGEDMDWVQEEKELQLAKQARTEAEFPDWIDTPMDTPAKVRFQRYRGLQSFKTSPWNPNENLPKEYSRLVQFGNYAHTYKKVVVESETDGPGFIPVGQRVKMLIRPIGHEGLGFGLGKSKPIALFSLFPHETKTSVLNLHLNVSQVIKNKEPLIFQVGFQRFVASPILSQASPGNKHKMIRYAEPGMSCMASVICPIQFPPAAVLAFKVSGAGINSGNLTHVASGSLFSIDPSRIIVKRILLSGFPYKSHGRKTTVRFMFFNREDIEWFKPVELRTRYGRRGHIKEPLGTHGHMKCIFDGPIKSQDTALMPLYKRVFPKSNNFDSHLPIFSVYDHYLAE